MNESDFILFVEIQFALDSLVAIREPKIRYKRSFATSTSF